MTTMSILIIVKIFYGLIGSAFSTAFEPIYLAFTQDGDGCLGMVI
jgi:hypothetical protein